MKVEKLCIGYPWNSPFFWTRVMDNYLSLARPDNSFWVRGGGWCSARQHNHICEQAIEGNASHVLILGADQIHPVDIVLQLIAHIESGIDVIASLVPANGKPDGLRFFERAAWKEDGIKHFEKIDPDGQPVQEISCIGSGVLLFPAEALQTLQTPWFQEDIDQATYQRTPCMDSRFVWRLKHEAKVSIFVDTTINVKHLIPMEVDDTFKERFNDWNDTRTAL